MTNGEVVSNISTRLKAVNKDAYIPRKTIISVAKEKAIFLIAQKLDEGSLRKESGLYKTLECFALEKIRTVECDIIEFRLCDNIMKSKEKLPELIETKLGAAIDMVSNIDNTKFYTKTTPRRFANSKKRQFSTTTEDTYYIKDGYLYLPDSTQELVNISLIPADEYEMQQKSTCSESKCKSYWDYEFVCPDRLRDFVLNATLEQLIPTVQIVTDELPDLDLNRKSQNIQ